MSVYTYRLHPRLRQCHHQSYIDERMGSERNVSIKWSITIGTMITLTGTVCVNRP